MKNYWLLMNPLKIEIQTPHTDCQGQSSSGRLARVGSLEPGLNQKMISFSHSMWSKITPANITRLLDLSFPPLCFVFSMFTRTQIRILRTLSLFSIEMETESSPHKKLEQCSARLVRFLASSLILRCGIEISHTFAYESHSFLPSHVASDQI
jgi:hypothetical protein